MIALRARREAMHVARPIEFPPIDTVPTYTLPAHKRMPQWWCDQNVWGSPLSPSVEPPVVWWKPTLAAYVFIVFIMVGSVIAYVW